MKEYIIKKASAPITEESFCDANVANVDLYPWPDYTAPYKTEARLLYTDEALFIKLKTDETKLRAQQTERDGSVCDDSCMEFFVSFDANDPRYFNFEINPIGTMLLHLGTGRGINTTLNDSDDIFDIKTIITKKGWELYYKVPFSFVLQYMDTITDTIKANFYKCGDYTVKEHYACWNEVKTKNPDFHRPEHFGTLQFEEGISVSK